MFCLNDEDEMILYERCRDGDKRRMDKRINGRGKREEGRLRKSTEEYGQHVRAI